jgi:hypothetical protein
VQTSLEGPLGGIVQVNGEAAESGVALVLFGEGSRPSTKGREVGEGWVVIVVSVPEWESCEEEQERVRE